MFELGEVVATPGALDRIRESDTSANYLIRKHLALDPGCLDLHDIRENRDALAHGNRILSAYKLSTGVKVWIITEADRSVTTILLPEEY
jgi:hypothetical protein